MTAKEREINSLLYSLKNMVQVTAYLRGHLIKEMKDLSKHLEFNLFSKLVNNKWC